MVKMCKIFEFGKSIVYTCKKGIDQIILFIFEF